MIRFRRFATPLGDMYATASGEGLTGLYFTGGRHAPGISISWTEDDAFEPLRECERQVVEYLSGLRKRFELTLAPSGSRFQQAVWREIARVPFGATITYARLAALAGAPGSARAAGAATGRNPLSIIVPCHRIIGADGSLTGYAGGLDRKTRLLELEGALRGLAA